jgi:hypothetical protein
MFVGMKEETRAPLVKIYQHPQVKYFTAAAAGTFAKDAFR